MSERAGCKWFLPELLRLQAVCNFKTNKSDSRKSVEILFQSIKLAKIQKAKFWELRSAKTLSHLWADQGDRQKAHDLLLPIYDWFSEGFGTTDLKEAKALLKQLQ